VCDTYAVHRRPLASGGDEDEWGTCPTVRRARARTTRHETTGMGGLARSLAQRGERCLSPSLVTFCSPRTIPMTSRIPASVQETQRQQTLGAAGRDERGGSARVSVPAGSLG
jgi:hypothetical protein